MRTVHAPPRRVRAAAVAVGLAAAGALVAPAASAAAETQAAAAPLTAYVGCYQSQQWTVTCQAYVEGGVGPYQYGFQRDALPWSYQGGNTWLTGCYNDPGLVRVTLRVRDATGTVATARDYPWCDEIPR